MDNYSDITSTAYLTPSSSAELLQCPVDETVSIKAMKAVVMVASILSILGALAIILVSYCKGERKKEKNNTDQALDETVGSTDKNNPDKRREERKENETVKHPARLIIVCMSVADILVAISHIWGVSNDYGHLQDTSDSISYSIHGEPFRNISVADHDHEHTECGAQAVLAIFGTISSFLWTDVLAFMAVVMLRSSSNKYLKPANLTSYRAFVIYNAICWGIPLLVTCILGGIDAIGFEEGVDVGWCYIHVRTDGKKGLWMFFSYEVWVSGSMLWILLMVSWFCATFYAEKIQKRRYKDTTHVQADEQRQPLIPPVAVGDSETKITHRCGHCTCRCSKPLIMIIAAGSLIVCRIWATSLDYLLFHSATKRRHFHCTRDNLIILTLAGFGNSCQGLVNFIIFYGFTGQCRKLVCSLCSNCCTKQRPIATDNGTV